MGSDQLNNITESCPFVSDNMVPEWAQMFADSLKPLIQNLQHSQGQQLKQSVIFDTPMIKFNMVGSSIQSIQFLARPTEQIPKHRNTMERITANPIQEKPQRERAWQTRPMNSMKGSLLFQCIPLRTSMLEEERRAL
jgi:hypothetical protein